MKKEIELIQEYREVCYQLEELKKKVSDKSFEDLSKEQQEILILKSSTYACLERILVKEIQLCKK